MSWDNMKEVFEASGGDITLEEYLEEKAEVYPEVAYYKEHGEWRDKSELTEKESDFIDLHVPNQIPNQCYYNAQTGLDPKLTYVEGYAVDDAVIVPHAWLEINGKVAEVTPSIARESVEYYGVEFQESVIREVITKREQADPIVEAVV